MRFGTFVKDHKKDVLAKSQLTICTGSGDMIGRSRSLVLCFEAPTGGEPLNYCWRTVRAIGMLFGGRQEDN